jgi:hypothetical protein
LKNIYFSAEAFSALGKKAFSAPYMLTFTQRLCTATKVETHNAGSLGDRVECQF